VKRGNETGVKAIKKKRDDLLAGKHGYPLFYTQIIPIGFCFFYSLRMHPSIHIQVESLLKPATAVKRHCGYRGVLVDYYFGVIL